MPKSKIITVWELWIREPPMKLTSFNKGKTWEGRRIDFWPFASFQRKKVTYLLQKRLQRKTSNA